MERTVFTDEVPVAEVRNGFVTIAMDGRPMVTCPMHTARAFCETTIRKLDAFEAEQAGRVVGMERPRRHG